MLGAIAAVVRGNCDDVASSLVVYVLVPVAGPSLSRCLDDGGTVEASGTVLKGHM